jgi:hypothetical protein
MKAATSVADTRKTQAPDGSEEGGTAPGQHHRSGEAHVPISTQNRAFALPLLKPTRARAIGKGLMLQRQQQCLKD